MPSSRRCCHVHVARSQRGLSSIGAAATRVRYDHSVAALQGSAENVALRRLRLHLLRLLRLLRLPQRRDSLSLSLSSSSVLPGNPRERSRIGQDDGCSCRGEGGGRAGGSTSVMLHCLRSLRQPSAPFWLFPTFLRGTCRLSFDRQPVFARFSYRRSWSWESVGEDVTHAGKGLAGFLPASADPRSSPA